MVDRFQHLDADGDGLVTQTEMAAAGSRMSALTQMSRETGTADHHGNNDN
jgi:hypothetical protein